MLIERIKIENFRSIRNAEIFFDDLTSFIGTNGAGKSTVLKAINAFFDSPTTLKADDYFARDQNRTISIQITFRDLSKNEFTAFQKHIRDSKLTIARKFLSFPGGESGKYFGTALKNLEFDKCREAASARERQSEYKALRDRSEYANLPPQTTKDAIEAALNDWEAKNPSLCKSTTTEVPFLGFMGVAKGTISRITRFVLIPAVRDAATESQDSKSPIHKLLDVIVSEAIAANERLRELRDATDKKFKEIISSNAIPELESLSGVLTDTMSTYYPNSGVALTWQAPEDFSLPSLRPDVLLNDEGFVARASSMGHGLQRAFIMTLLQHLAVGLPRLETQDKETESENDEEKFSLIIAIEEPELYQHPTRQKHFASLLRDLTKRGFSKSRIKAQIIHATHSPAFLNIDYANEIRLTKKVPSDIPDVLETVFSHVSNESLDNRLREIEQASGPATNSHPALAVIPRGHMLSTELSEGFFAKGVVLCERVSDVAAILAQASISGIDFTAHDIAVLPCGGKSNIERPHEIFSLLGIPTYCVWDGDVAFRNKHQAAPDNAKAKDAMTNSARLNKKLMSIVKETPCDWPNGVFPNGTALPDCLEETLKEDLGDNFYSDWFERNSIQYGYTSSKDAQKNPYVLKVLLSDAKAEGRTSATLERIVAAIKGKIPAV